MSHAFRELVKKAIKHLPLRITKNQIYDFQTKKIIKAICKSDSNCIDIGAHTGEITDLLVKYAPKGKHFLFEPIPSFFASLKEKYKDMNIVVSDIALSNEKGSATFNHVINNPAYSGLNKRIYKSKNEAVELITVRKDSLDNIIPDNVNIQLIKIDVEGAELQVLEGAKKIIMKNKPHIIFEHGLGASEYYDSTPKKVFDFMQACGLNIYTLSAWIKKELPLSLSQFESQYHDRLNYYFIASV